MALPLKASYDMLMKPSMSDIAVVGGGPAGFVAAILLAQSGAGVRLYAPPPPRDQRTTALLRDSVALMQSAGVWDMAQKHAAALNVMRMVDNTGRLFRAPTVSFDSAEDGGGPFGYNIRNVDLHAALQARAARLKNLAVIHAMIDTVTPNDDKVQISGRDGSTAAVRLVVGADGYRSICRNAADITLNEHRYEQTALAFNVTHTLPHNDTSTEFHTRTGPFTLVPLPGRECGVVWVVRPDEAQLILALDDDALCERVREKSYGILGDITGASPRGAFPLMRATADRLAANRIALVGEAGHVLPPIGAQGLNLGFRDAAVLCEIVEDANRDGRDPGADDVLAEYDARRKADVAGRAAAIDLLNRSVLSGFIPFQLARSAGLALAKHSSHVRTIMTSLGMGNVGETPRLMRG